MGFHKEIYRHLGYQEYDPQKTYKISPYVIVEQLETGFLMYNTLTYELMRAEEIDWERNRQFLARRWYLVEDGVDPYSISKVLKHMYKHLHKRKRINKIAHYTILTTTNCNARCFYCYEAGCEKHDMTEQTANDVADYIARTCAERITIQWFGGEPLYNGEAISTICRRLTENNVPYISSTISNGYLFDRYDIDTIRAWNLDKAQITLDGGRDTYNATKNYTDANHDPFEKVMDNIEYLLSNDIMVNVRINLTKDNIEEIYGLSNLLRDRFRKYKRFSAYPHPIFEGSEGTFGRLSDEERNSVTDGYIATHSYMQKLGLCGYYPLGKLRMAINCMADNMMSLTISPKGQIGLCEHYCDSGFIGDIYSGELDPNIVYEWQQPYEIPLCKECPYHPQCVKIRKCPTGQCTDEWRRHLDAQVREAMKRVWRKRSENNDI